MKKVRNMRSVLVLLAIAVLTVFGSPAVSLAATINLGTTSSFAVLSGQTITNTGPTTIAGSAGGDLGLFPGTAFPGLAQVTRSGSVHLADTVASKAKDDLVTAYTEAAARTPETAIPPQLGGTVLSPGVYVPQTGADFNLAGTLTLDGGGDPEAVFIFKTTPADGALNTESGSNVVLINGARPCRVFWVVGSSASLGTNSHFVGHIFALTSITAKTGATIQGQLLARNGSVTLDTNTITNGVCVIGPAVNIEKTASKAVVTSGSGSVTFTYFVTNPGTIDVSSVVVKDNKLSPVTYVSGDFNNDKVLQPYEVWVYTGKATLKSTTTNTATVSGSANGTAVSDTAAVRVRVSTANGGQLPDTATPWYTILLLGVALTFVGMLGWWKTTRKMHE